MRFSEPVSRRKVWREIIFADADTVRSLDLFLKNRISRMETKCVICRSNVLLHACPCYLESFRGKIGRISM